ncbi:MAG: hypothetical protein MK081_13000 [Flavobacteriales bacterium]|nr:hypothetical protein [Flavobacteriales bacterium]
MMKKVVLIIALLFSVPSLAVSDTLDWKGNEDKEYKLSKRISGFSLNGYYRFYGFNRSLDQNFQVLPDNQFANTPPYVFGVGDVYRDPPIFLMTASIRPGGGASISMDYALYSHFTGSSGSVPNNLNLGISLYGTVPTEYATIGFQLGGINWVEVSDMVFSSFVGYNRFSLFERWAWEGNGQGSERADIYMQSGDISRDGRWANQAFKGALFDLTDLPAGLSARLMFGKTAATTTFGRALPASSYGGRLRKSFENGFVGVNTMNYLLYTDSIATQKAGISLHTINGRWANDKIAVNAEAGIGSLFSPMQELDYGEAVRVNVSVNKITPWLSGDIDVFRLAPEFVNYFGNFLSSNTQIITDDDAGQIVTGGGGAAAFAGSITDVGQILNNRQGFSFNLFADFEKTHISIGNMVSEELERASNRLSFGHKINGLALSRFAPFAQQIGPYGRWSAFYRGVAEDVFITHVDSLGLPQSLLGFNTLQYQIKQRVDVLDHPIYLLYNGMSGSVGDGLSLLPIFNDEAYLRTNYHEFDFITPIRDWLDLSVGVGLETIKGNDRTNNIYYRDLNGNLAGATVEDISGDFDSYGLDGTPIAGSNYPGTTTAAAGPIDQRSTSFGVGLDVRLSKSSGLYIRHKRFTQKDENFVQDDISGTETTIELKVFF